MLPHTIAPLVRRHAEDAAFYWQQLDTSVLETGLRAQRALHFAKLLDAHLEGLAVAGAGGLAPSLEALERWKKPGEAFVAFWSALSCGDDAAQARVMAQLERLPDLLLRGAIGALARAPEPIARAWVQTALAGEATVPLVAALRASALHAWPVAHWPNYANHANAHVRAAACRSAQAGDQAKLEVLLADADPTVCAEAAIRLAQLLHRAESQLGTGITPSPVWLQCAAVLWQSVATQAERTDAATGWNRLQAQRRLGRWLRHLAWLAPLGHAHIGTLLAHLPLRSALQFVLAHGDMAHLPFVLKALEDPEQSRYAGWVWQSLTGIDLAAQGLVLPEAPLNLDAPLTRAQQDADQGLPLPNAGAVAQHPLPPGLSLLAGRQRVLLGQALSPSSLPELLALGADTPQALRAVAAHAWCWLKPAARLNLRASATDQLRELQQLQALVGFS